jgi:hypothetical protein
MKYLAEKYGHPEYSDTYAKTLVRQERFPPPVEISPRRWANTQSQLDRYGQAFIDEANNSK